MYGFCGSCGSLGLGMDLTGSVFVPNPESEASLELGFCLVGGYEDTF